MQNTTSKIALGLMSGTSLDGVDAAFIETDGERIIRFGPRRLMPYKIPDKRALDSATQAALRWQFKGAPPNSFSNVEAIIHRTHLDAVNALCEQAPDWAERLDIIGFHGQTVLHHPAIEGKKGRTLQLGDGQKLANSTGVPVAYNFRQADIDAGGQGAPLAPIYHKALAEFSQVDGPVAILNLGGVGNVTLIDGERLSASDTGPANGPLDQWIASQGRGDYDKGGQISLKGNPDFKRINQWLKRSFFIRSVPRSADRYDFDVLSDLEGVSPEDGAATLAAFTALSTALTLSKMFEISNIASLKSAIICGGGRHNKAMMWMLAEHLGTCVKTAEDMGWDSDAIEAQAFGYLAVRTLKQRPISFPLTTGVARPMTGGIIAAPIGK